MAWNSVRLGSLGLVCPGRSAAILRLPETGRPTGCNERWSAPSNQFANDFAGFVAERIRDLHGAPDRAGVLFAPVDPHRLIDRGVQIANRHQAVRHLSAAFI